MTNVLTFDPVEGVLCEVPLSTALGRKYDVPLVGTVDGVNTVFTTPDFFLKDSFQLTWNGLSQQEGVGCDFVASESAGVGTGYDTLTLSSPPRVNDVLLADYLVA